MEPNWKTMPRAKRKATSYPGTSKRSKTGEGEERERRQPDALLAPRYGSLLGLAPGFPKMLKFKHKYATQRLFTTTSGVATTYVFRANGMYDPDFTGVGHQPLYFDQMGTVYNHWYVVASKIKWTFVPDGTSVQAPYRITCYVDDDSTPSGALTPDGASEQTGSVVKVCQGGVNPSKETITMYYDAQKTWGNNVLANSRQRGTVANDPSEQIFFHGQVTPLNGSSTVTVYAIVEIEYTAIWNELQDIVSS